MKNILNQPMVKTMNVEIELIYSLLPEQNVVSLASGTGRVFVKRASIDVSTPEYLKRFRSRLLIRMTLHGMGSYFKLETKLTLLSFSMHIKRICIDVVFNCLHNISLRVRERNFCVLTYSFLVIPGFLFVIVVVDDKMEAKSRSSLYVQKRNENDNDISLSFSYSLS